MNNVLVWIRLETGGLAQMIQDKQFGHAYYSIFEVIVIFTDTDLNVLGRYREAIYQDEDDIANSSQYAIDTHNQTGLMNEVRESGTMLEDAESAIIEKLKEYGVGTFGEVAGQTAAHLAGQSISHEQLFISTQMPRLLKFLHQWVFDIGSLSLAQTMWNPEAVTERLDCMDFDDIDPYTKVQQIIQNAKFYRNSF